MGRFEMLPAVADFVVFDDDEASEERKDGGGVEDCVDVCPVALLRGGVRGLEDQDCLGGQEEAEGVEQGVRGEEDQRVDEDGGPDCGRELEGCISAFVFETGVWRK